MAKGQQRSNREIRKPKQDKIPPKAENSVTNQLKRASTGNAPRAKPRAKT